MTKPPLGRLTRVDLREYWLREDTEFTPWLGAAENLELLGEAIGRELERQGEEVDVGPFRADLLCKDTATGDIVLIENQIEKTDHAHLGQILTYAAGLGAKTIVWISRKFQEEHRAALDWLNEHTSDEIEFYGVQVELWRIGDSAPAPRFDVVAHPNEWSREVRESARAAGPLSETDTLRLAFWKSLAELLERAGSTRGRPTAWPHPFWNWGIGRSEFSLCLSLHPKDRRIVAGAETQVNVEPAMSDFSKNYPRRKFRRDNQLRAPLRDAGLFGIANPNGATKLPMVARERRASGREREPSENEQARLRAWRGSSRTGCAVASRCAWNSLLGS